MSYHVFHCTRCHLAYKSDYHRPGLCPRCWCADNPEKTGKIAGGLAWQVGYLEHQANQANHQDAPEKPEPPAPIPNDMLKRLMQLCHPDKHSNSQMATRVFQDLQAMKARK